MNAQHLTKAAFQGRRRSFHFHPSSPATAPKASAPDARRASRGASYFDDADIRLDDETGRLVEHSPYFCVPQVHDDELEAQIDADAEAAYERDQWARAIASEYAGGGF